MVSVASLLNPAPPSFERFRDSAMPALNEYPKQSSPALAPSKKQKMSKAAATFVKGKPKGEINYPPYEIQDEATAAEHAKFEVQPIGRIGEYPKRIPYKSEKKTFQQKTGMDGFEVYQYTFRMPEDSRDKDAHTVMWDYNVGFVRVTSFFKSLKHSKTMPARVMTANKGLREISHSITGGSISAQGYWVPFEAAKAVSARFCYQIRYVLVPVFGPDFVSMCEKYGDPKLPDLDVGPSVIDRCTQAATAATADQAQSRETSVAANPRPSAACEDLSRQPPKSLRPKFTNIMDAESGYGTDSDRSDKYPGSPDSPRSIEWTPVNTLSSAHVEAYRFFRHPPRNVTSNPRRLDSPEISHSKRMTNTKRGISEIEDDHSSNDAPGPSKRRKTPAVMTPEVMTPEKGAALTLMELNMADATLSGIKSLKRRRAST